ncbi:hypothetical protein [Roseomonas sp. CECT 9278]|uniref:hypothetical protein n=1 Tax=Roseomonas sp. CECT 9278 TaxID=2845823 RepID=UPI001E58B300|nr:hypothetical protein [Roseomonas sp. CECT 9278]CAH0288736.1 hypothetical protein ROS9278_04165 [Roseomonas sp. CECT 9278]
MLRMLVFLVGLGALGAGAWWFVGPFPPREVPAREVAADRTPRPSTFTRPAAGASGLQTPFGDAMFRWRCTTGLRDALGDRTDWPLRRVAGLCLCVADRMREDGLRDVPQIRGDGLAAALAAAEAQLCRPP